MDNHILEIQKFYPRIYIACHKDHVRASSSESTLSQRDATILAHLSIDDYTSPSVLAKHLNVTRATISEALSHLTELDYVTFESELDDERKKNFCLTEKGVRALSRSSVLDYQKLEGILANLPETEKIRAVAGLKILADAAFAQKNQPTS